MARGNKVQAQSVRTVAHLRDESCNRRAMLFLSCKSLNLKITLF